MKKPMYFFNLILQAFPRFVEILTSYSLDNQKYFRGKGVSIYYVLTFVSSNPFWCIPWVIWKVQKIQKVRVDLLLSPAKSQGIQIVGANFRSKTFKGKNCTLQYIFYLPKIREKVIFGPLIWTSTFLRW